MNAENEFERAVARALEEAGIPFQSRLAVDGVEPDFVVESPDGRIVIVETKGGQRSPGFAAHAAEQAEHYRSLTGADAAYVVVKELERSRPSEGVVSLNDLVRVLRGELEKRDTKPRRQKLLKSAEKSIFAAMPFSRDYEDTFFVAMAPAADSVGAVCRRVDQEEYTGDIVERVEAMIRSADAVITDLSESKPNVLYESGFARALGKPTVAICATPLEGLPFDVGHWNVIKYGRGQTHELKSKLTRRLKALLA